MGIPELGLTVVTVTVVTFVAIGFTTSHALKKVASKLAAKFKIGRKL